MNFDGRREGISSAGVEVPEVDCRKRDFWGWISYREERMPDRIAMPIVPGFLLVMRQIEDIHFEKAGRR